MFNKVKKSNKKKNIKVSPIFLIALFNFLLIIFIAIYLIYLRFIPYCIVEYDGYAVAGKTLVNNLLNKKVGAEEKNIKALEVKEQDEIYKNLRSYYIGASREKNINLNYPIYVNDTLALYNLSPDIYLFTTDFQKIRGYKGVAITSGALYNANTLERADYNDYMFLKTIDNLYINSKELVLKTNSAEYKIGINSIINFDEEYVSYYTLENGEFVYRNILDIEDISEIYIADFNEKYTYKDLLIGLEIIHDDSTDSNDSSDNTIIEEPETPNDTDEPPVEIVEETTNNVWQKPVVTCTNFNASTYTANATINISDPSRAIKKAITFTFYIGDDIAFRTSATSSGIIKVTKLIPQTTYRIIGNYQYINQEGALIETTFLEDEITTLGVQNINPIDLYFENGQIYSNKIELKNLSITSNLQDEAISGVSRAEITIGGKTYQIGFSILRSILRGNKEIYQSKELPSSTKYDYEIKFYDTANNEMKLNNNKGNTLTCKERPTAKISVSKQKLKELELSIDLINKSKVTLSNYRYVIYNSLGKVFTEGSLENTDKLTFNDLDPESVYAISVYADFDIEDGKGMLFNEEIGNATFTTASLDKIGILNLDLNYNEEDLTDNSFTFNTSINKRTNDMVIKLLKEVTIQILTEDKEVVETIKIADIDKLQEENGIVTKIRNLNSNTKYLINISAVIEQGNITKEIIPTYTLRSFTTRKKEAQLYKRKVVVTDKIIDLEVMIYDPDGALMEGTYNVDLRDAGILIGNYEKVTTNEWHRYVFNELTKDTEYELQCYTNYYNETNDNRLTTRKNFLFADSVEKNIFITKGLSGDIELNGLIRENFESKNLIDAESYNNWYSQCFGVVDTRYYVNENDNTVFETDSLRNYGKVYDKQEKVLKFTANQCYVYNLEKYIGQNITISFYAKVSNNNIKDDIYIQHGKSIATNIEKIDDISTNYGKKYEITTTVPDDGYIGFYIGSQNNEQLFVKELQVELGTRCTEYSEYSYKLCGYIDSNVIDENHLTYDGIDEENIYSKYYIRIYKDNELYTEDNFTFEDVQDYNEHIYEFSDLNDQSNFRVELIIKAFEREYILDTVEFKYNKENCYEIRSIHSNDEFLEIQPYGNYIILTDINITEANSKSEFTFGNNNIAFQGSIDFNGKNVLKDTYSNKLNSRSISYIFYNIAENAEIRNIVLNYYIDNIETAFNINILDGMYSLFLYNNGKINNIMLNLEECNETDQRYIGLIGYKNRAKGIIEDFVIRYKTKLYGTQYISGGCLYSYGTLQNGYIFADEDAKGIEVISHTVDYDSRKIGGLVYCLKKGGIIQNVYNLSEININHTELTNSFAANIVYRLANSSTENSNVPDTLEQDFGDATYNDDMSISRNAPKAIVRNVYSIKDLLVNYKYRVYTQLLNINNKEISNGPNIYQNDGQVESSYYFSETMYEHNDTNSKQDVTQLNDTFFQNSMLNANGFNEFVVDKYVNVGLYPHLQLNPVMPKQENVEIENTGENDIMDILSSELVNYEDLNNTVQDKLKKYNLDDENVHIAMFKVYNPSGKAISKINIEFLQTDIIHFNRDTENNKIYIVYAVLHDPTVYVNNYNILSIYGTTISGKESFESFGEGETLGKRTIDARFVKHITTENEWDDIDNTNETGISGLVQNYKLDTDLDFENSQYIPTISGNFTGDLDCQNHVIRNVTSQDCLFDSLSGNIRNLYVENFTQNGKSNYIGLIGRVIDESNINNVHVKDITLSTTATSSESYIGGICSYVGKELTLKNSSVSNLSFEQTDKTNYHTIGGMIGYSNTNKTDVKNCFVKGLNINVKNTYINGIGGIIGSSQGVLNILYCYTEGMIVTSTAYAGGIYGKIDRGNAEVQYCYSLVNITSSLTSGNEYVGGIGGYCYNVLTTKNNLYVGNTYVAKETTANSRRIVGNQENSSKYSNYAYKDQILNGVKSTTSLGATELLEYGDLFNEDTYINKLGFGADNEKYQYLGLLGNNYFPKLLYDDGRGVLPNQEEPIMLSGGINIISMDAEYTNVDGGSDNAAKITMRVIKTDNIEITGFDFENDEMIVNGNIPWKKSEENGETIIEFVASPTRYLDTYKMEKIRYTVDNQEKMFETSFKIKLRFYRDIYNVDDWNNYMNDDFAENYKIKNDLDLKDVSKLNVIVARIEADEPITISNLNLTFNSSSNSLIKDIKTNIQNISFDNCKIKAEGVINEIGIIYTSSVPIKDCNFSNITISSRRRLYCSYC